MRKYLNRIMLLLVLFFSFGIACKKDINFRDRLYYYLYQDNIVFSKIRNFYNRYLGNVFPLKDIPSDTVSVFDEKLQYINFEDYYDGCLLEVSSNYLVPSLTDGVVTYIGKKENYGLVVIVNSSDNKNIWYGGLKSSNFKLYDSVSIGDYIGEVDNNIMYLVISDGKKFLDYHSYLE